MEYISKARVLLASFLLIAPSAFSDKGHKHISVESIPELVELQALSIDSIEDGIQMTHVDGSRLESVKQVAITTGVRRGRRWRQQQHNE